MDPFTISLIIAGGSSIISSYGKYQEGKAAAEMAKLEAKYADMAADDAIVRGGHEAGMARMEASKIMASQRNAYAAAGIDPSSGAALDIEAETRLFSEYDVRKIRANAAREAWGHRVNAQLGRFQADLTAQASRNQLGADILGVGMDSMTRYYSYQGMKNG